jgi:hypothetical protein
MLQFFYMADYKHEEKSPDDRLPHFKVHQIADKFGVSPLVGLALSKLTDSITRLIQNESLFVSEVKWACKYVKERDVFNNLMVVEVIKNMTKFLDDKDGLMPQAMLEVCQIGRDVARALRYGHEMKYKTFAISGVYSAAFQWQPTLA